MTRLELHEVFVNLLGSRNVYFQPPETLKIKHPCIIYSYAGPKISYGSNIPYIRKDGYSVTLVDEDPEPETFEKLLNLPYSRFGRFFSKDNLNHWTFMLYVNHKEELNNG